MIETIPQTLLDAPISGLNLHGNTLHDELPQGKPSLVVFIRHFG